MIDSPSNNVDPPRQRRGRPTGKALSDPRNPDPNFDQEFYTKQADDDGQRTSLRIWLPQGLEAFLEEIAHDCPAYGKNIQNAIRDLLSKGAVRYYENRDSVSSQAALKGHVLMLQSDKRAAQMKDRVANLEKFDQRLRAYTGNHEHTAFLDELVNLETYAETLDGALLARAVAIINYHRELHIDL